MAKTGSITITTTAQSTASNTSTITLVGTIVTSGESYRGDQRTGTITVTQDGTAIYNGTFQHGAPANSTTTLFTVTGITVTHKSNGTSGTIVASYNYDSGWCTASTSTTLSTISRACTITYNANGGSGAPSAQSATIGQATTLRSTKPTRTGYTFLGWSTSSTATSATYSAGGSITPSGNTTLYAVWKIITYTVSYNANGGSGAPANQTKTYGVTLTLSSIKPSRTGYTFLGWSTSSSATTATYAAGATFTTNANTTLYAVWQIQTYTVSYNANGGVGAPSSQTKTYGVDLTLSSVSPTRAEYTFKGWATSLTNADSNIVAYYPGSTYSGNAALTLFAVWELSPTNTITFNSNGATSGSMSQLSYTDSSGQVLPSCGFTKTGYKFVAYNTEADGSGDNFYPDEIAINAAEGGMSITLYCIWKALPIITVDPNGGVFMHVYSGGSNTTGTKITIAMTTFDARYPIYLLGNVTFDEFVQNTTSDAYAADASSGSSIQNAFNYIAGHQAHYPNGTGSISRPSRKTGYAFVGWANADTGEMLDVIPTWASSGVGQIQFDAFYLPEDTVQLNIIAVWKPKYNCFIKKDGKWVTGTAYVRDSGTYKTGSVKVRDNSTYR